MKSLNPRHFAILILVSFLVSFSSSILAQNIAVWDFELATASPSFTEANMTADPAAFGPNQTGIAFFTGNGSAYAYSAATWPTTPELNPNSYIEFTVTPDVDYMIDMTNFSFDHRRSGTGIRAWELRSSLDGFTATIASDIVADVTTFFSVSVPLPPEYQDITTSITFRIYGYNAEGTSGTWRFDNVQITGMVEEMPTVPVSNWAILIGVILMVSLFIFRYRR